jgi:hypothetical protein
MPDRTATEAAFGEAPSYWPWQQRAIGQQVVSHLVLVVNEVRAHARQLGPAADHAGLPRTLVRMGSAPEWAQTKVCHLSQPTLSVLGCVGVVERRRRAPAPGHGRRRGRDALAPPDDLAADAAPWRPAEGQSTCSVASSQRRFLNGKLRPRAHLAYRTRGCRQTRLTQALHARPVSTAWHDRLHVRTTDFT